MKYFVAFLCVLITPLSFAENKTQNWDYKNPSLWGEIPDFKFAKQVKSNPRLTFKQRM